LDSKSLFLIRHAKSSYDDPQLEDFDRPLNKRGQKDAPNIAGELKTKKVHFDLILSSPAKRTQQTAKCICKGVDYEFSKINWVPELYLASLATLLKEIKNIDQKYNAVAIIAHNPGKTDLANFFLKGYKIENMPTTGILKLDFKLNSWKEIKGKDGELNFFISPKKERTYLQPINL
jgi:phosphohistidine phosphatase